MRVLLIGNYPYDAQESMQRFASMMLSAFQKAGITAELMVPKPYFGRLKKSGHGFGKWLGYIDKFLIFPILLQRKLSTFKSQPQTPSIVHICDHSNAFYTRFLQNVPHVVTCHDLLAVRSARGEIPENPTRWSGRQLQGMVVTGLARARHVVCVSEATRRDVHRLIPMAKNRVSVISAGFNYPYSPMPKLESRTRIEPLFRHSQARVGRAGTAPSAPEEPPATDATARFPPTPNTTEANCPPQPRFILHVGGNQWYKNRLGVLRIYGRLAAANAAAPFLVMAGKPFTEEMEDFVAANRLQGRVFRVEGCSNEDLRALYSLADLLLFPSLAEGFGWPVIEAQACGCPVICSSIEPFPEVTRDSASMLDPADEPSLAIELERLLAEPAARADLSKRGLENTRRFAPTTMAANYIECYKQLLEPVPL